MHQKKDLIPQAGWYVQKSIRDQYWYILCTLGITYSDTIYHEGNKANVGAK